MPGHPLHHTGQRNAEPAGNRGLQIPRETHRIYHIDATPRETIGKINKELELVHHSFLAPWQKIDATSSFITPKIDFALRTGVIEKSI